MGTVAAEIMSGLMLAQSAASNRALVWVGVLLAAVLIGGFFMILLRKRLFAKDAPMESSASLMESVRQMHKTGQISTEEFDRVRKKLARQVREKSERGPTPGEAPTGSDATMPGNGNGVVRGVGFGKEFGTGAGKNREERDEDRTGPEESPKIT